MSASGSRILERDIHLKRLQKTCEITLHRLIDNATNTCNMAGKLRSLPAPRDKRLEFFLQKKREDAALDAYQKARTQLLEAIEGNMELPAEALPLRESKIRGTPRAGLPRRHVG